MAEEAKMGGASAQLMDLRVSSGKKLSSESWVPVPAQLPPKALL